MNANEVHIWTARPERLSPLQWAELQLLLDEGEREQAARFRFDEDRRAYVLAHALRRQALSFELGVPPHRVRFWSESGGKPALLAPSHSGLYFGHSHNRRAVAIAATRIGPIGIDIEPLGPGTSPSTQLRTGQHELLDPFIEASDIAGFHAQWTALEAFWKANGKGLDGSNPRIRLEFVDVGCCEVTIAARSPSPCGAIRQLDLHDDCAAALALLLPQGQALRHVEIFWLFNSNEERR
jgi:4'-phosphopantetheinyl transferase